MVADGDATSVPIVYTPSAALVDDHHVAAVRPLPFAPASQRRVTIALRCFDVRVVTSRSIFGDRVHSLALRYPDRTTRRVELDGNGAASLRCLPAGRYELSSGGSSLLLTRSITVTGDVRAHVVDVTDVDLAVVVALVGANVVAVVVWLRHRRRRPSTAVR